MASSTGSSGGVVYNVYSTSKTDIRDVERGVERSVAAVERANALV